jgi:tRNA U34 2-thiouridine synthase MnmA/TrmU
MLNEAKKYMEKAGADFVFTGEVLGQRPKSQTKRAIAAIDKEVGLDGRLLRPLSARLLPATIVEKQGLVDRDKLHDISGRGRKRQIVLAERFGLDTYMQPAGGCCFLTDEAYSKKFRDTIEHTDGTDLDVEDVLLLGVGRHFRLSPAVKLIVGRDEVENNFLSHYEKEYWAVRAVGYTGPTAIVMGDNHYEHIETIASVVARYSDGKTQPAVNVRFKRGDDVRCVSVSPAADDLVRSLRV